MVVFSGRKGVLSARKGNNGERNEAIGGKRSPKEGSEIDSVDDSPSDRSSPKRAKDINNTWTSRVGFTLVELGVNSSGQA